MLQGLQLNPKIRHTRPLATLPPESSSDHGEDERMHRLMAEVQRMSGEQPEPQRQQQPFRGVGEREGKKYLKEDAQDSLDSSAAWDADEDESEQFMESARIAARAVPVSASYFSRKSNFNDAILLLQSLVRKYSHLPMLPNEQVKKIPFQSLREYRLTSGEDVKAAEYRRAMNMVKRLYKIHPKLRPAHVWEAVSKFRRARDANKLKKRDIPIDKFGRALAVGKRKTSVARAWVVEGTGEVLVNGKSLAEAFGRVHDRESVIWALKSTARIDKYNVWAIVQGGGTTGQAEALAIAVAKALEAHEPALKPALRRGKSSIQLIIVRLFVAFD